MKNLEEKFEKIKRTRKQKPEEILLSRNFLWNNRTENIKYWTHEINILHNDEYKNYLPEEDSYDLLEFDRVAIVGNSGSLLGSGRGGEIDDHNKIVRFNTAPTGGFEEDVGSETDFRFSIGSLTFRSGGEKLVRSYRRANQAVKDKGNGIFEKDWHLVLSHRFCDWVQSFKDTSSGNGVCSTGFQGVFFGILLAEEINLYGFKLPTDGSDFKYHYYNDNSYVERSHKFKQEHKLYDYLDTETDWFNWMEV